MNEETFDGSQQTFPKLLQGAGYETALVRKVALEERAHRLRRMAGAPRPGPYYKPPIKTASGTERLAGYTTDIITDLALDWLRSREDGSKPFLLMLHHKAPHRWWDPGPKHLTMYDDVEIPEPDTLFDDYAETSTAAHNHGSRGDVPRRRGGLCPQRHAGSQLRAAPPRRDARGLA